MTVLQTYVSAVAKLTPRDPVDPDLTALNARVQQAAIDWNERAFDHTWPFLIADVEPNDTEEADDFPQLNTGSLMTVVDRWDLNILDPDRVIAQGRHALRQEREGDEHEIDISIGTVGSALAPITHTTSDPWYAVPGVEVLGGSRVFIRPTERQPLQHDIDDPRNEVVPPDGDVEFSETWS